MNTKETPLPPEKAALKERGWLKISYLAQKAGVSVSRIHYYVQQGLISPPARTSRNMAYYDPVCLKEIRIIQELQATRYMPLSAIRLLLQAGREGQGNVHIAEMRSFFEEIFHPLVDKTPSSPLTLNEMVVNSGLEPATLKELEEEGLIVPRPAGREAVYDDIDLNIARNYKKLAGFGVIPRDLKLYHQYIDFLRLEAEHWHEMFHTGQAHESVSIIEFFQTVRDLRDALALRVLRVETQRPHSRPAA
jgi:DNA-binding transcriptional MerR regulator